LWQGEDSQRFLVVDECTIDERPHFLPASFDGVVVLFIDCADFSTSFAVIERVFIVDGLIASPEFEHELIDDERKIKMRAGNRCFLPHNREN
jgi:hypothetical protein